MTRGYRCEFAQLIAAIPPNNPAYGAAKTAMETGDPHLVAQWAAQTRCYVTPRDIQAHRRGECGCS